MITSGLFLYRLPLATPLSRNNHSSDYLWSIHVVGITSGHPHTAVITSGPFSYSSNYLWSPSLSSDNLWSSLPQQRLPQVISYTVVITSGLLSYSIDTFFLPSHRSDYLWSPLPQQRLLLVTLQSSYCL